VETAKRPAATRWADALEELQATLGECTENAAHAYAASLTACPWCTIELRSGVELFNYLEPVGSADSPINVEAIWHAINAIPVLEPPPVPDPAVVKEQLPLSPDAQLIKQARMDAERVRQAGAARASAEQTARAEEGSVQAAEAAATQLRAHLAAF